MTVRAGLNPMRWMRSGIIAAPSAIVPIRQVSSAPKTRPNTSFGVTRMTMVSKLTSTSGLASPSRATATRTLGTDGQIATSMSGKDHSSTPVVRSCPSRLFRAREIAQNPPITAPIPSVESR